MIINSGLQPIGDVEAGTHFCHFYKNANDLEDTLIPFFKTGIEENDAAIWVTAEPFGKARALASLNTHVTHLDDRIRNGQVGIYDHKEWYTLNGQGSRHDVAYSWIKAKDEVRTKGYRALRLTGNTGFLTHSDWDDFMEYEMLLRDAFRAHELVALCSYDSARCEADNVLDIVRAHDFALSRRHGTWEVVESAALKQSKFDLAAANATLEARVEARTRELSEALGQQRLLNAELSHRVKNSLATVQSLVDQTLRQSLPTEVARQAVRGRLIALAGVHDLLAEHEWRGVKLREMFANVLAPYGNRVSVNLNGEVLNPRAALDLALVFHELATNAVKYGALSTNDGHVEVGAHSTEDGRLVLEWTERGSSIRQREIAPGFGTRLIKQLVAHGLRGTCETRLGEGEYRFTLAAPRHELLAHAPGCCNG